MQTYKINKVTILNKIVIFKAGEQHVESNY